MLAAVMTRPTAVPPAPAVHCAQCGILIFSNQYEARQAGRPFYAHINARFGDLCTGCAQGNQFYDVYEEERMSKTMAENNMLIKIEAGVSPPDYAPRGNSKYQEFYEAIESASVDVWYCMTLSSEVILKRVYGALNKWRKAQPFELELTQRCANGESAIYFRKTKKEEVVPDK